MVTVERATRLTPEEFWAEAEPAFRKVFRTFDLRGKLVRQDLFQNSLTEGLILGSDSHLLFLDAFVGVSESARAGGDDSLLYTILYAFQEGAEHRTWRLPLIGYEEYTRADTQLGRSIMGIPLETALYSPQGDWGVFSDDTFSILAGTTEFVQHFKKAHKFHLGELSEFMDGFREASEKRGVDVSWVQPLLDSLYGAEAPRFET